MIVGPLDEALATWNMLSGTWRFGHWRGLFSGCGPELTAFMAGVPRVG